jgi:SAM-dependent methyltransferase
VSENLVRDIHDAVACSENPAQASVRPPGTTTRELAAMRRDVLGKLHLYPNTSVLEIGCGVGLLGVPIARRAASYVGLDFAPRAVRVANERLQAAGVGDCARALCLDVLGSSAQELSKLGRFDRVLMYAVLHYARDEREAVLFLRRTLDLLAPSGRALIGNLPLEDLRGDWQADGHIPKGLPGRLLAAGRWVATPGSGPVPLTRGWKTRHALAAAIKRRGRSPAEPFAAARLPPGYTLTLTTADIERWLVMLGEPLIHTWELPAPSVPLAPARADLILQRP